MYIESNRKCRKKRKLNFRRFGVEKKMFILFIIAAVIIIWFHIPYSPLQCNFQREIDTLIAENPLQTRNNRFKEEDFLNFPAAIQKYVQNCGYIGKPRMPYLKMVYHNVRFMLGRNGPALTIDYTQYDFIHKPCRMALIDSRLFGIPFEGCDYYENGEGSMKGVIGKIITLFNQKGRDMDKACLVTYLAESIFAPAILLQNYIKFEEISDLEVSAVITYGGQTAGGIFTFNEQYEMISFTTNDRAVNGTDGTVEYIPWSVLCSNYQPAVNGIKYPADFQAVWNYADGDFIYFDGTLSKVSHG